MVDIAVESNKGLPLGEYGVLGIGSFNWDYILKKADTHKAGERISLEQGESFRVLDQDNKTLLEILGPYTPDGLNRPGWELVVDDKHKGGNDPPLKHTDLILGADVQKRAGGGIINLARAFLPQSVEIPFGIMTLRGGGCLDELVEGAYHQFIEVKWQNDQGNIVFPGTNLRTIIRGKPLVYSGQPIFLNPDFEFKIGTIVVNSLDSLLLTQAAINLYNQEMLNHEHVRGILAITPKMKDSYELISKEAIPNGFITIFSPLDLIKYAFRGTDKGALNKAEEDITYSEIVEALQKIRSEQNGKNQRIYVTLGGYGSIGVGTNGSIYRVDVFSVYGDNKTGAGDVFAATVTKYEHRRFMHRADRLPIYEVMAYASAASAIHINGSIPYVSAIHGKLRGEGHAHYEALGNIDTLSANCPKFQRKLGDVRNSPISGTFFEMKFKD